MCSVHSNTTNSAIAIARLEKEMYQSGQRRTLTFDTTPLSLNLDFLKAGYDFSKEENQAVYEDEEEDYHSGHGNLSLEDIDYNYLME